MDSLPETRDPLLVSGKQNLILIVKFLQRAPLKSRSFHQQLPITHSNGKEENSRRCWELKLSEVTPYHILAAGFLAISIACSVGAVMSLLFGALRLFPIPVAADLFLESAGGGVISGLVWAFISRSRGN